jgi:hypothetical protein
VKLLEASSGHRHNPEVFHGLPVKLASEVCLCRTFQAQIDNIGTCIDTLLYIRPSILLESCLVVIQMPAQRKSGSNNRHLMVMMTLTTVVMTR